MPEINNIPMTQYVGPRVVPHLWDPIEWDDTIQYDALAIVQHLGDTFISRYIVPVGIDIENAEYWVRFAAWNAQVEQYIAEVRTFDGRITQNADDIADAVQAIADEVTARTDADTALGNQISELEGSVTEDVETLTQQIEDEAEARESADDAFEASIGKLKKYSDAPLVSKAYLNLELSVKNYDSNHAAQGGCVYPDGVHYLISEQNISDEQAGFTTLRLFNSSTKNLEVTNTSTVLGHSNDFTYNDNENVIVCAGTAINGPNNYWNVYKLDPSSLNITEVIHPSINFFGIAYDNVNDVYYALGGDSIRNTMIIYTLDTSFDVLEQHEFKNYGSYTNGCCYDGTYIYFCVFPVNIVVAIKPDGTFAGTIKLNQVGEIYEVEWLDFNNGTFFVCSGNRFNLAVYKTYFRAGIATYTAVDGLEADSIIIDRDEFDVYINADLDYAFGDGLTRDNPTNCLMAVLSIGYTCMQLVILGKGTFEETIIPRFFGGGNIKQVVLINSDTNPFVIANAISIKGISVRLQGVTFNDTVEIASCTDMHATSCIFNDLLRITDSFATINSSQFLGTDSIFGVTSQLYFGSGNTFGSSTKGINAIGCRCVSPESAYNPTIPYEGTFDAPLLGGSNTFMARIYTGNTPSGEYLDIPMHRVNATTYRGGGNSDYGTGSMPTGALTLMKSADNRTFTVQRILYGHYGQSAFISTPRIGAIFPIN